MLKKIVVLPLLVLTLSGCSGNVVITQKSKKDILSCWSASMNAQVYYFTPQEPDTGVKCVPPDQTQFNR